MATMAKHYPTINPQAFDKFYFHFIRLFKEKVLVDGTDDIYTTDLKAKRIAFAMLRKAYEMLQPYEETIIKDSKVLNDYSIVVDIPSVRAVAAMMQLCEYYHGYIEPTGIEDVDESEFPDILRHIDFSPQHRLVEYDAKKARAYYNKLKHQFGLMLKGVIENTMKKKWGKTKQEGRADCLKDMKREIIGDFIASGFFKEYPADYPHALIENMSIRVINGAVTPYNEIYELYDYAYGYFFDEDYFLDDDIVAGYLWKHQHTLSLAQQQGLFVFMESRKQLQKFEYQLNEEPQRYKRDWEISLHDCRKQVLRKMDNWWESIPKDKRIQAIKDRLNILKANLYKSGFMDNWKVDLDDSEIDKILGMNLDNLSTKEKFKRNKFMHAVQEVVNDSGAVDDENAELYLWENRLELSPQQIKAFFSFCYSINRIIELCNVEGINVNNFYWAALGEELDERILGAPFWDKETIMSSKAIFGDSLARNKDAYEEFVKIVKEISKNICINRGRQEGQWKWWHLRDALIELKLISKDSCKSSLSRVFSAITGRTFNSINTSLKRKNYLKELESDQIIVNDIKNRLEPVMEKLKG